MNNIDLRVLPITVQRRSVEKLRSAILSGMFKPGDKLIESDLCGLLGVSRPSVREALRSLEAERLVTIIPNRGPQIPVLTWEQATQIYDVRALLEGEAASLAAQRATEEDVREMRNAIAGFRRAVRANDARGEVETTVAFYAELLRVCGNRIIEETLHTLLARINFLRGRSMSMPGRAKFSLREMKAIVDAIEAKDPAEARRAASYHVAQAHQAAHKSYEQQMAAAADE
jgi:DNA-binding GntR family transcriptional regulator